MSAKHLLNLDIPETNNPYILQVKDASIYASSLPVTCNQLYVTLPGFNTPVEFDVQEGFDKQLSACDLGIQSLGCGVTFDNLPDGIYIIRYSVSPNAYVYVEYNFLRQTNALNQYYTMLANLEIAMSDPDANMADILKELRWIKTLFDAAKVKVEIAHNPIEGMDLFNYAVKRFKKLIQTCN